MSRCFATFLMHRIRSKTVTQLQLRSKFCAVLTSYLSLTAPLKVNNPISNNNPSIPRAKNKLKMAFYPLQQNDEF